MSGWNIEHEVLGRWLAAVADDDGGIGVAQAEDHAERLELAHFNGLDNVGDFAARGLSDAGCPLPVRGVPARSTPRCSSGRLRQWCARVPGGARLRKTPAMPRRPNLPGWQKVSSQYRPRRRCPCSFRTRRTADAGGRHHRQGTRVRPNSGQRRGGARPTDQCRRSRPSDRDTAAAPDQPDCVNRRWINVELGRHEEPEALLVHRPENEGTSSLTIQYMMAGSWTLRTASSGARKMML